MIFGVIVLTAEYWQELPWYVYILIIGLALISFAMYDEKRKQLAKSTKDNILPPTEPIIIEQQIPNNSMNINDISQQEREYTVEKRQNEESSIVEDINK